MQIDDLKPSVARSHRPLQAISFVTVAALMSLVWLITMQASDLKPANTFRTGDLLVDNTATVGGSALLNGDVNLGNAAADHIAFNGSASTALSMNTHQIHSVTDPTSAQDAATQAYVLAHAGVSSSALTTNRIPKATGAGAIGDSTGTSSIGSASTDTLTINSTTSIPTTLTVAGVRVGGSVALASSAIIANTETVVVSMIVPANTLAPGDSFQIYAVANPGATGTGSPIMRVRIGPTTLSGVIPATLTGIPQTSTNPTNQWGGVVTVRTIGGTGTALGTLVQGRSDGAGYDLITRNAVFSPVTIDTTVQNLVELTFISANAAISYTFLEATITRI